MQSIYIPWILIGDVGGGGVAPESSLKEYEKKYAEQQSALRCVEWRVGVLDRICTDQIPL